MPDPQDSANPTVDMLLSIREMINSNLATIEHREAEMKKFAEMLESILDNDPYYREQAEQAKQANQAKSKAKQQVMKMPQAADLASKVKGLRNEIRELRNGLSDYLQEYFRLTGSREIEDGAGEIRQIVYVAKLIKGP